MPGPRAEIIAPEDSTTLGERPTRDALTEFSDPLGGIPRATAIANALAEVVRSKGLSVSIQGREHLKIEGWLTLGALCGVVVSTAATRADEGGYWARTEVIRLATGEVIGAAESRCDFSEMLQRRDGTLYERWDRTQPHSCMSMAQTRSASKALAQALRWIPGLAGFSGTPYEEMPVDVSAQESPAPKPQPSPRSGSGGPAPTTTGRNARPISEAQRKRLWAIWSKRYELQCADASDAGKESGLRDILGRYGLESTRAITTAEYESIVRDAEQWMNPYAAPDDRGWGTTDTSEK